MIDGLVPVEYLTAYQGRAEGDRRRVDPLSAASLLDRGIVRLRPDGDSAVQEVDPEAAPPAQVGESVPDLPPVGDDPEPEF